jgi:hypothetical protein
VTRIRDHHCVDELKARLSRKGLRSLSKKDRGAHWEWRKRKDMKTFTDYTNEATQQCVASIGGRP